MVSPESASKLIDSLRNVTRHARTVATQNAHRGMLPPTLGALLSHIDCSAGHRQSAVAAELGVTPSTLSRQIAYAEALGYVVRTPDLLDGRASLLSLTAGGVEALRVHREVYREWAQSAIEEWTEEEVKDLTARLERLSGSAAPGPKPVAEAR